MLKRRWWLKIAEIKHQYIKKRINNSLDVIKFQNVKEEISNKLDEIFFKLYPTTSEFTLIDGFFIPFVPKQIDGLIVIEGPSMSIIQVVDNNSGEIQMFSFNVLNHISDER